MTTDLRYCWEFMRHMLLLVFCATISAQEISTSLFNGLEWRLIGPFRGGRAVAVTGVPGGGSTFYFGAVDGGVWKTSDAGTVWTPIFDSEPVASIGAIEVAPSDPNIVYVGTGESDIRSDLASGNGVYRSVDGGKTWTNIGLQDTRQISRIVVNPRDPNLVFVAALGHAYGPNEERGIFRSTNGGQRWEKVLDCGAQVGAADLAMARDEPNLLVAAMWNAHRPPWSTYAPIGGPGTGIYRSKDGGNTWQQLTGHGLPGGEWGRPGVAIARGTNGKRVYAVIDAKDAAGLYRSDDGGDTWVRVNQDPRITSRAWYFNCITVDPNNPDLVYVPNVALYRLSNGGRDLVIVRGAPGGDDYHQLWIDPSNSRHMVLGTDQGTTVSLNGGETWSTWYNQPTAQLYHVITDNEFPYHVYGAQQDSGTAASPSQTDHGQIDARDFFTVGGSESGYIAPDPRDPNIFYVSGTYGSVARFDCRMMQSQNIAPSPVLEFGKEIAERKYRDPWTPVLVFSPVQPFALYLGSQYVMKTVDGGLHWQVMSPDLTGAKKGWGERVGQPITVENAKERGYGVVYSIAPSPLSASEIWAGSDTGLIHLTRDGGKTWSNVTPSGLTPWSKITQLEASHFITGGAYAAVDRHRLDDMRPYLYRTRDFGKTWKPIKEGIADHAFVNCVREDPNRKGLLFAGTELGVYVSFNDGERWLPLQLNLPVTSVRDLVVHGNDLVIATHGRSFWILDDISPLRQIDEHAASTDLFLYKPARALRMTSDKFLGTPLPPEEPQAQNRARGAYLDYYLRGTAPTEVRLEILDGHGRTIRHFSSREKPANPPERAAIASRWFPKPHQLSEQPGMHRFVWDLRYGRTGETNTADADDSGVETWVGPLVTPGLYKVKLVVNGRESVQPLEVAMDPRSHMSKAEIIQQFQWAQRAFDDMISARKTAGELRALAAQLTKDKSALKPANQAVLDAISAVNQKIDAILSGREKESDEGLESVGRALTVALNSIESADRTPPSQVITLYENSAKILRNRISEWNSLKSTLPALNQQLRAVGLDAIQLSRLEEEAEDSLAK